MGVRACEPGDALRVFAVTDLVLRLSEARRAGTLERLQQDLQRADLLVLDEWGDCPRGPGRLPIAVPGHRRP